MAPAGGRNSVLPEKNRRLPGAGRDPVPAAAVASTATSTSAGTKRKTPSKTIEEDDNANDVVSEWQDFGIFASATVPAAAACRREQSPSRAPTKKSSRSKIYQLLGKESDTKSMCKKLNELCKSDALSENSLREVIERYGWTSNNNQLIHSYVFFSNACRNERVTEGILRCLLEYFPSAARIAQGGRTPLHVLCGNKNVSVGMVQLLIDAYPESLSRADKNDQLPLHDLWDNKEIDEDVGLEILKFLIEKCPESVRAIGEKGRLPIHNICHNKNITLGMVQLLIDAYPESLRRVDNKGYVPLRLLCGNKEIDEDVGLEILKYFIERCPESVRHTTNKGALPLHIAAICQSPEFCRILIESYPGSERVTVGNHGPLPIHWACQYNNVATVKCLLQLYPESICMADNNGLYPIHYVIWGIKCRKGDPKLAIEVLQFLLDYNAVVVQQKHQDKFPLFWVCKRATDDNAHKLDAYLKVLRILYDAYPEAIEEEAVVSNVGRFCQEVQTFIKTQLTAELLAFCQSVSLSEDGLREIIERYIKRFGAPKKQNVTGYAFFRKVCRNELVTEGIIRLLLEYFPDAAGVISSKERTLLHHLCQNKYATLGMVQLLIDAHPDSLIRADNMGYMPLHDLCGNKEIDEEAVLEILKSIVEKCPESVRHAARHGDLPIHLAAIGQSPEFCRILIEAYPGSERMTDDYGFLPFDWACKYNTVATAKYLLRLYHEGNVADMPIHDLCGNEAIDEEAALKSLKLLIEKYPESVRHTDEDGDLPIHIACRGSKSPEFCRMLIEAYPESERMTNCKGVLPFHEACRHNTLTTVKYLYELYPGGNVAGMGGICPIHRAVWGLKGREDPSVGIEVIQFLMDIDPDDLVSAMGQTPLHIAFGHQDQEVTLEIVQLLIDAYPDSLRHVDANGYIPLNYLCVDNQIDEDIALEVLKLLLERFPESVRHDADGGSLPLHFAAAHRSPEFCRLLLEYFPDAASATDEEVGNTPLHEMCYNNNATLDIVQLLIDAHPESLRRANNDGYTPLHRFCGNEDLDETVRLEILKLLLERCPESVRHDDGGCLPLHRAAGFQSPEFCRILIDAYPESERMTVGNDALPFHWACGYNTVATVKYLYKLYPESITMAENNGQYPIHSVIGGLKCREDNLGAAVEVVKFLLDCNPKAVLQKYEDKFPLYWVCSEATNDNTPKLNAYLEILQLLYGADPDAIYMIASDVGSFCPEVQSFITTQLKYARQARDHTFLTTPDESGQLPLHRALRDNVTLGSIKMLVKGNPFAIRCADNTGMIPLHVACQHHDSPSFIEYLVGLNPMTLEANDLWQNTVLHFACRSANHTMIRLLLEKYSAASVSKRNFYGQLPIDLLFDSKAVNDREDIEYIESIYRLIRAHPETLMG